MDFIIRHLNFIGFLLLSWKVFFPNVVIVGDAFGKEMYRTEVVLKTNEAKIAVCLISFGYILRVFDYLLKNF